MGSTSVSRPAIRPSIYSMAIGRTGLPTRVALRPASRSTGRPRHIAPTGPALAACERPPCLAESILFFRPGPQHFGGDQVVKSFDYSGRLWTSNP